MIERPTAMSAAKTYPSRVLAPELLVKQIDKTRKYFCNYFTDGNYKLEI